MATDAGVPEGVTVVGVGVAVTVTGGEVTVTGGEVTVTGGEVTVVVAPPVQPARSTTPVMSATNNASMLLLDNLNMFLSFLLLFC
jgi:hypothetical protein